ncbi:hypothetical protein [Cohnella terricola]|uniref:DUF948 domain-containing protein n=1 Tax=Cohnella terricola TaxID=1289167 RepID=A0A559JKK6_9BACL|nr:hypothetical protein [Cohnella terricola]TVY00412.1 hypothetical protein FPZ45_10280 [Cohnella terricola]
MAWQVAGYAFAAAIVIVATAIVIFISALLRSIGRLDRAVTVVSEEAEVSLQKCANLADEAKDAIAVSRKSLEGFVVLAEGARALGNSARATARTAAQVTEMYREFLASPFSNQDGDHEHHAGFKSELAEVFRKLWTDWTQRPGRS